MQNNQQKDIDELLQKPHFNQNFLGSASNIVRKSLQMPSSKEEIQFYTRQPVLKEKMKTLNQKLIQSMQKIFALAGQQPSALNINKFNSIIDVTDILLENVDLSLDQVRFINEKTQEKMQILNNNNNAVITTGQANLLLRQNQGKTFRPQEQFKDLIDNSDALPFIPRLKIKHNALVPLDDITLQAQSLLNDKQKLQKLLEEYCIQKQHPKSFQKQQSSHQSHNNNNDQSGAQLLQLSEEEQKQSREPASNNDQSHQQQQQSSESTHSSSLQALVSDFQFPHPYQNEIEALSPLPCQLSLEIESTAPFALTPDSLTYVETVEQFNSLLTDLRSSPEFSMDLEHHSQRTFQGLTCLIQISTRKHDYVLDPFPLWRELPRLNEVTSNPNIVKVLHGADWDVQWLQRDFGVYLVNMFDTGQAARMLQLQSFGLAYLLQKYCNVHADKRYQLADWTQRPLSREMLQYAREDTHYLLFVYDKMRQELVEKALKTSADPREMIKSVLKKSAEICLKRFVKPVLKDYGYHAIAAKHKIMLSSKKYNALLRIMQWRDLVAREEDVSTGYVMENVVMFKIVNALPLNSETELNLQFNKMLSDFAKARKAQLLEIIKLDQDDSKLIEEEDDKIRQSTVVYDQDEDNDILQQNQQQQQMQIQQLPNETNKSQLQKNQNIITNSDNQLKNVTANNNNNRNTVNFTSLVARNLNQPEGKQVFTNIPIKKIEPYQKSSFICGNDKYRKNGQVQSKNNQEDLQVNELKKLMHNVQLSFNYNEPLQLLADLNPVLKTLYQQQQLIASNVQKPKDDQNSINAEQSQQVEKMVDEKPVEQIDFIEVPEIKEQNFVKKVEKVYRLPPPQGQPQQEQDILPLPLSEQCQINLGRKNKRKIRYGEETNHGEELKKKIKLSSQQDNKTTSTNTINIYQNLGNESDQQSNSEEQSNSQDNSNEIEDENDEEVQKQVQKQVKINKNDAIMNQTADQIKQKLQSSKSQFMYLPDPIDQMYRDDDDNKFKNKSNKKRRGNSMIYKRGGINKSGQKNSSNNNNNNNNKQRKQK